MRRWFKELNDPTLKCARVGHREVIEYRKGYRRSGDKEWRYYPAVGVTQERPSCYRCKVALGEWVEVYATGFDSISWPSDLMEEFRRNGERWSSFGYRAP